jgi:DNA processing protein
LLTRIVDPPDELWTFGLRDAALAPCVAVVGSRRAAPPALRIARDLARGLADAGVTVVSGLAFGIDAAAHEGALEAGRTIAVLPGGVDRIYPATHDWLGRAVADRGFLVSEYPPGTAPRTHHFPRRNRIISGLSLAVVLVEVPETSGALITARCALEQEREVFVVPATPAGGRNRGGHLLVNDGARLVEHAGDVLAALRLVAPGRDVTRGAAPPDDAVLRALIPGEPADLDDVVRRVGRPAPAVLARLATLELEGWVERGPGGRFVRLARKW